MHGIIVLRDKGHRDFLEMLYSSWKHVKLVDGRPKIEENNTLNLVLLCSSIGKTEPGGSR